MLEFIILLKQLFNWRVVRSVAELQILTKASYFMLILVPILAGLWPTVRLYVNSHNDAVIEATKTLEGYSKTFDRSKLSLKKLVNESIKETNIISVENNRVLNHTINKIEADSIKFKNTVKKFTNDFIPRTLDKPLLPWSWAAAFFASLLAVVAHLMYQWVAPPSLKKFTIDEFVKIRKEGHSSHSLEDDLVRAQHYIDTKEGQIENKLYSEKTRKLYKKIHDKLSKIWTSADKGLSTEIIEQLRQSELSRLQEWIPLHNYLPDSNRVLKLVDNALIKNLEKMNGVDADAAEGEKNMSIVERGARAEYIFYASEKLPIAIFTIFIYAFSIFVIFEIIYIQAVSVMETAGWNNILDIFII